MKKLIFTVFCVLFFMQKNFAECGGWHINVFPKTKEIALNSLFP